LLQAVLQINDVLKGKSIPGSETTWLKGKSIPDSETTWVETFFVVPTFAFIFRCPDFLKPVMILAMSFVVPMTLAMIVVFVLRAVLTPVAWLLDYVTNLCGRRRAELDLRRVQTELERSEFDQTMCPICLEQFATSAHAGRTILSCRHKFHNACIEPWANQHSNCPLCRADVEGPIAPEDEARPQDYQRRLRFYLSRLQYRHPRYFTASDSSNYRHSRDGRWLYFHSLGRNDGASYAAHSAATYATSLQSRYESVMRTSQLALSNMASSSGRSGRSGGGGGFGGGGGGGGGW